MKNSPSYCGHSTYKAARTDARYIALSHGNAKLKSSRDTEFLIWNLPALITCPHATAHCAKSCYACRAELSKGRGVIVHAARLRRLELSLAEEFAGHLVYSLLVELRRPKLQRASRIVVRIHEGGDFYSAEYFNRWVEIIRRVNAADPESARRVIYMAYTKSLDYIPPADQRPANLVLMASLWDDSPEGFAERAADLGLPIYTAVQDTSEHERAGGLVCRCSDCGHCGLCWDLSKLRAGCRVACKIH